MKGWTQKADRADQRTDAAFDLNEATEQLASAEDLHSRSSDIGDIGKVAGAITGISMCAGIGLGLSGGFNPKN